jgi:hypothetical protein
MPQSGIPSRFAMNRPATPGRTTTANPNGETWSEPATREAARRWFYRRCGSRGASMRKIHGSAHSTGEEERSARGTIHFISRCGYLPSAKTLEVGELQAEIAGRWLTVEEKALTDGAHPIATQGRGSVTAHRLPDRAYLSGSAGERHTRDVCSWATQWLREEVGEMDWSRPKQHF